MRKEQKGKHEEDEEDEEELKGPKVQTGARRPDKNLEGEPKKQEGGSFRWEAVPGRSPDKK